MESKFAHIIVFFLLATSFETLMARKEVIKFLTESESLCNGKLFWPELVGVPTKLAKEIIVKENSLINDVRIVLSGSPVPLDYRCNRVFLVDNILGVVVQIPVVG
ncbi:hypothetical protein RDI58_023176 [Solanum bulbocastanum]|uniref:Uncharacterized protein n=1 Tax=Solanum bulbocastanum TaxID=147425 RepID=A0AAN8T9C4_SOLBU